MIIASSDLTIIRTMLNLSLRETADLIGTDSAYVCKIENGVFPLTNKMAERITGRLNLDRDKIIELKEDFRKYQKQRERITNNGRPSSRR